MPNRIANLTPQVFLCARNDHAASRTTSQIRNWRAAAFTVAKISFTVQYFPD
jgi:hypothetical protein